MSVKNNKKDKKVDRRKKVKPFKNFFEMEVGNLGAARNVDDFSHVAEAMYGDGQDSTAPSVQPLADGANDKNSLIRDIILDLEDLKTSHNWSTPLNDDLIQAMATTLKDAGIEPTDFYAAIGAPPEKQEQYLIYGPSSWQGGNGALNDLKRMLAGPGRQAVQEDESDPASDLAAGSTSAGDALSESTYRIGRVIFDSPFGTGIKYYPGIDRITGNSKKEALRNYILRLAREKKFTAPIGVLYNNAVENGVEIEELASSPEVQPQYWWQDKD